MKIYLIEITNTASGTAYAMNEKTNKTQAEMTLHQVFASAIANPDVDSCLCIIMDNAGNIYQKEFWGRDSEIET